MGLLAMALLWLMRRLPRGWWVAAAAAVVVVAATLWVLVSPVVLDPLFNRFTPLRAGAAARRGARARARGGRAA